MKGIQRESELHAPARALFKDGNYDRSEWRKLYMAIGDRNARMRWLGDRLLEMLESRNMRDLTTMPPGLAVLINDYRSLGNLPTIQIRSTFQGHTLVLRMQSTLMKAAEIAELLQNKEETW